MVIKSAMGGGTHLKERAVGATNVLWGQQGCMPLIITISATTTTDAQYGRRVDDCDRPSHLEWIAAGHVGRQRS